MLKRLSENQIAAIAILFSAAYQALCAIQGFDLTDEGFLMNAYRWIGEDPSACKDAGGYTLSCLLGWFLHSLTPGVLPMRLWGVLVVTITEIIVFLFLSRFVSKKILIIGLLFQTIFLTGDPKPFDYNNLTGLAMVLSFIAAFEGMERRNRLLMVVCGMLVGCAIFFRLPNVLFSAFIFAPFFYHRKFSAEAFLEGALTLCGIAIGAFASWKLLESYHITSLITDYISYSGGTLSGSSTHNLSHIITKYSDNYLWSVITLSMFAFSIVCSLVTFNAKKTYVKILGLLLAFEVLYYTLYIGSNIMGHKILALYNAIAIVGCAYYYFTNEKMRFLALGAVTLSIIGPLGSDCGFETSWTGTWLALPLGLCGFFEAAHRITTVDINLSFNAGSFLQDIHFGHVRKALLCSTLLLFIPLLVKTEHKPYYDPANRTDKVYSINNKYLKNVYTIKKRTDIVNEVLEQLPKYIKPGDKFLQYDFSPLFYYMMDAKPFTGVSWPCVLYGERFLKEFKEAEENMQQAPVVLLQNFNTSNKWKTPIDGYLDEEVCTGFICPEHTIMFKNFIQKYNYRKVWSNEYFDILVSDYKRARQ